MEKKRGNKVYKKPMQGNVNKPKFDKKCYLEADQRGFFITCNFQQWNCVREADNLLEKYAALLKKNGDSNALQEEKIGDAKFEEKGAAEEVAKANIVVNQSKALQDEKIGDTKFEDTGATDEPTKKNDDVDDLIDLKGKSIDHAKIEDNGASEESVKENIDVNVSNDIAAAMYKVKGTSSIPWLFREVHTGIPNCIFLQSAVYDPVALGALIVKEFSRSGIEKPQLILRFMPVEIVCRAKLADIVAAAGVIFDRHFAKQATTFSILVSKRCNNNINRIEIIENLAKLVVSKNAGNRVDLKRPFKTVVVEAVKGMCCLAVIEKYFEYRKYNLAELAEHGKQIIIDEDKEKTVAVDQPKEDDAEDGAKGDLDAPAMMTELKIGEEVKDTNDANEEGKGDTIEKEADQKIVDGGKEKE